MNQSCRVCGEVAAGYHFGAFTCEGCKSFFGRTYTNRSSIGECKNNNECIINKKNRTSCKSCRLKKCFSVGMSKSGSRYGRRSNWFKIHCLLQDQGIMQQQQQQQQQHQQLHQELQDHTLQPPTQQPPTQASLHSQLQHQLHLHHQQQQQQQQSPQSQAQPLIQQPPPIHLQQQSQHHLSQNQPPTTHSQQSTPQPYQLQLDQLEQQTHQQQLQQQQQQQMLFYLLLMSLRPNAAQRPLI